MTLAHLRRLRRHSLAGRSAFALLILSGMSFTIIFSGIIWLQPNEADTFAVSIIAMATVLVVSVIWSYQYSASSALLHHLHHASVVIYSYTIASLLFTPLALAVVSPLFITGMYLLTVVLMSIAILSRVGYPPAAGAILRFLLDTVMIAVMVWIGLSQIAPQVLGDSATIESSAITGLWAIETGLLFAFAAASGQIPHRSPVLILTSASMLVRWIAMGFWLGLVWYPQTVTWQELVVPLVILHWALVVAALGMSKTMTAPDETNDISRRDWTIFSALPTSFVLIMIVVGLFGGKLSEQREILLLFALLASIWISRTIWESRLRTEADRTQRIELSYALQCEQDAVEQVRQARHEHETMVRGVLHDISYPLLALVQIHRTLAPRLSETEQYMLQQQVLLIEQMNEQLRTFLSLRRQTIHYDETDVRQVCLDAVMQIRTLGHPVQVRMCDTAVVWTDAVALRRILDNVLINAGDFRADDDPVQVVVRATDAIMITITNERSGNQPRIGIGSGLGRIIVEDLIRQIGGRVTYQFLDTGGQRVTLALPITPAPATSLSGMAHDAAVQPYRIGQPDEHPRH